MAFGDCSCYVMRVVSLVRRPSGVGIGDLIRLPAHSRYNYLQEAVGGKLWGLVCDVRGESRVLIGVSTAAWAV